MVHEHNDEVRVEARPRAWTRRVGFGLVAVVVLFALIVPWFAPDPTEIDFELLRAASPSWEHPAGTDALGRDNLARLAEGTAVSVGVGTLTGAAALFALFGIGAALGFAVHGPRRRMIAGIAAGLVGLGAIAVFAVSLPTFRDLWAIYLLVLRDALALILVFAAFGLTAAFRATRDIQPLWASLRHVLLVVLPWAMSIAVVVIVYESQLSFLGVGVSPPQATLGSLLSQSRDGVLALSGPWWLSWPALGLLAALAIGRHGSLGCFNATAE